MDSDPVVSPSPGAHPPGADRIEVEALTGVEGELADVGRSLERLDDGTYGRCEVCGDAIDDGLLARDPTAQRCTAHAT